MWVGLTCANQSVRSILAANSGVRTYYAEFQNENAYLSEGRIEADYSSCYTTQFGDWRLDHLRTDEMVYEVL